MMPVERQVTVPPNLTNRPPLLSGVSLSHQPECRPRHRNPTIHTVQVLHQKDSMQHPVSGYLTNCLYNTGLFQEGTCEPS